MFQVQSSHARHVLTHDTPQQNRLALPQKMLQYQATFLKIRVLPYMCSTETELPMLPNLRQEELRRHSLCISPLMHTMYRFHTGSSAETPASYVPMLIHWLEKTTLQMYSFLSSHTQNEIRILTPILPESLLLWLY